MQSTFSGIHDPLGFVKPFILHRKIILQGLFEENVKWDETVQNIFSKALGRMEKKHPAIVRNQKQQMFCCQGRQENQAL